MATWTLGRNANPREFKPDHVKEVHIIITGPYDYAPQTPSQQERSQSNDAVVAKAETGETAYPVYSSMQIAGCFVRSEF